MSLREEAAGYRRSGVALGIVSWCALVMVCLAIPARWWTAAVLFEALALGLAWCAGGELRMARELREQADWIEASS